MARELNGIGFDGVDLTVRAQGHVAPEQAASALPRAVEAIRTEGLEVPMVTTELLAADEPAARPLLTTAGKLGVRYFKPGYYRYSFGDVRRELRDAGAKLAGLVALARAAGIQLAYHNHGGSYVGAPLWDVAQLLERLDRRWAGHYLDTRHLVAEGGAGAWKIGAHLAAPRTKVVAVKDFYWEKGPKGWAVKSCPLGEGMVDLGGILAILVKQGFAGPISLHIEYPVPGGEDGMLQAAARDLRTLRASLAEAQTAKATDTR